MIKISPALCFVNSFHVIFIGFACSKPLIFSLVYSNAEHKKTIPLIDALRTA